MIYYHIQNDKDDNEIKIIITTSGEVACNVTELSGATCIDDTTGDEPIVLNLNSEDDNLFSPIKTMSATVTVYSNELLDDLYSSLVHQVDCAIYKVDDLVFYGYLTPNQYNREWEYYDEIELEFVSPISTLDSYNYPVEVGDAVITDFFTILQKCLNKTSFYGTSNANYIYVNATKQVDTSATGNLLANLYLNEKNFFDDDDEQTPWTCKDVIIEMFKYLGYSLVEWKCNLYAIDYQSNNNNFYKIDLSTGAYSAVTLNTDFKILDENSYADADTNITFENTYQKITINDNLYDIDSVIPDIDSDLTLIGTFTNYYGKIDTSKEPFKYNYTTAYYRFYTNNNYNHYAYILHKHIVGSSSYQADAAVIDSVEEVPFEQVMDWLLLTPTDYSFQKYCTKWNITTLDYSNPLHAKTWRYVDESIMDEGYDFESRLKYLADHAVVPLFAKVFEFDPDNKPSSYDWKDRLYVTLGCTNHCNNGESWVEYGRGGMWTQHSTKKIQGGKEFLQETLPTLKLLDTKNNFANYIVSSSTIKKYINVNGSVTQMYNIAPIADGEQYGDVAFSALTQPNTFTVKLSNEDGDELTITPPLDKDSDDKFSLVSNLVQIKQNVTFDMYLTETQGYATEIPDTMFGDSKTVGLSLYPSSYDFLYYNDLNDSKDLYSNQGVLIIQDIDFLFCQNTNTEGINPDEEDVDDIIYTNTDNDINPDGSFVGEYDDIELKINTQNTGKPFGYSNVIMKDNNGYLVYNYALYDKSTGFYQTQEKNLVVMYYNHYCTPKIKLEATLWNEYDVFNRLQENNLGRTFCIDEMEIDLQQNKNKITLIEY